MKEVESKGIIYCLKFNDFIIYVGKSFGEHRIKARPKEHFRQLKNNRHSNKILQSIYNIYGEDKLKYEILKIYDSISNNELGDKEKYYIEEYNTYSSGANSTIGGDTVTGMRHTEESKLKMSKNVSGENNPFYGKTHTLESRVKMSEANKDKVLNQKQIDGLASQWEKGVPKSESHRKNISKALMGRKYSDETIKKMSDAKKGKKWTQDSKDKRLNTIRRTSPQQVAQIFVLANFTNKTNSEIAKLNNIGATTVSHIKNLKSGYMVRDIIENYAEVIKLTNKLLKFEKESCSPCQMVQNLLEDRGVKFDKIDAFANPELSSKFDIGSLPTLVLLNENGEEIQRSIGFKPGEIEDIITKL